MNSHCICVYSLLPNRRKKALCRIEYCKARHKCIHGQLYKIEELKLRRKRNLVKIMHTQSTKTEYMKTVSNERNFRSAEKIKMKNEFTSKT